MVPHYVWVNYNELTTSSLEIMVSKGNHPQMAARFRLVNYYNLPRLCWLKLALFSIRWTSKQSWITSWGPPCPVSGLVETLRGAALCVWQPRGEGNAASPSRPFRPPLGHWEGPGRSPSHHGFQYKTCFLWMIWGYPNFRNHCEDFCSVSF